MESLGFPQEMILEAKARANFQVLPDNVEAIKIFLSLGTQWRIINNGLGASIQGLDYQSLAAVLSILEPSNKIEIFHKIQLLERGALEALKEKQ